MGRFHIDFRAKNARMRSRYQALTSGSSKIADAKEETEARGHGVYGALLFDKRWRTRRQEILARDGHCCIICSKTENLQIHHRQYHFIKALQKFKAPWDYEAKLLITLCERCHSRGHSKFKVPNVYI